jgi:hypothetical protein
MSPRGRTFAVRFTVPLLAAGMLAVATPRALADPGNFPTKAALATERYLSSYGDPDTPAPPAPSAPAATSSSGPSWTSAILAGFALTIAAGLAGIAGGRATRRPKLSA